MDSTINVFFSYRKCYGLSIIHYDMKLGGCALRFFKIIQSICAGIVHLSLIYNEKIGVQYRGVWSNPCLFFIWEHSAIIVRCTDYALF